MKISLFGLDHSRGLVCEVREIDKLAALRVIDLKAVSEKISWESAPQQFSPAACPSACAGNPRFRKAAGRMSDTSESVALPVHPTWISAVTLVQSISRGRAMIAGEIARRREKLAVGIGE